MTDFEWIKRNQEAQEADQIKADAERRFAVGPKDGDCCANCRFWWDRRSYPEQPSNCVRHAPKYEAMSVAAESPVAIDWSNKFFPQTFHDDWCGDHKSR